MAKRRVKAVAAYPVELIHMFQAIAKGQEFKFNIPYRLAAKRRHEIYRLRSQMRNEAHYALLDAEQAFATITPDQPEDKDSIVLLHIRRNETAWANEIAAQLPKRAEVELPTVEAPVTIETQKPAKEPTSTPSEPEEENDFMDYFNDE